MVNYLGFEHYRRWDFSRDKKYALSDKTKHFLDAFKGKVRITVFFSRKHADHRRRAESADGISVRRQGKDRRRVYRSGTQPFAGEGAFRQIQSGHATRAC